MVSLRDHLKKASKAQHEKYSKEDYSRWGSKGRKFLEIMTREKKKEYFRNIRNGKKVKII